MERIGVGRLSGAALLILGFACAAVAADSAPPASAAAVLQAQLSEFGRRSGGTVGVAAWRLDGAGPRVELNGAERFPMASTFKVAVAGAVFAAVDAGKLRLDQMITVDPALHVDSEVIADRFVHPGVSLSVHNLLELMLTQSDNTATDVLTALAGGPRVVTDWLGRQGISGQRIDRDTAGILRDFFALPAGPFPQALMAAVRADPKLVDKGARSNPAFDDDPRDTSTPEAMAQLLAHIFSGRALSAASTAELTAIMERCRTGETRLKGRLPAGTAVAHKTGTIGGSVNDVGVITLPEARGRIVMAVFVKKSDLPFEARELAIAEIARAVHDYYLYGVDYGVGYGVGYGAGPGPGMGPGPPAPEASGAP